MRPEPRNRPELPPTFPIFPLPGALLLPAGRLPLNIFEPRYVAMVEDALTAGRIFGMIQPEPGRPATETGPALYRIGCLGRVSAFGETEDGRFLVTLTALSRFRVTEELAMRRGYRRVRADFSGFQDDLDPQSGPVGVDRQELVAALRRYFAARALQADWVSVNAMDDATLVGTLAAVCPFEIAEKQALLEAPTPQDRARSLLALLRMGAHLGDRDGHDRRVS